MSITLPSWEALRANPAFAAEYRRTLLRALEERKQKPTFDTPGDLAKAIQPNTVQTPALDIIDEAIVWAWTTPGARLLLSMPPQEGKSQRCTETGTLWALLQNPERRLAIISYGAELAQRFGRNIRNWITANQGADGSLDLRLRLAADNKSVQRWKLDGHAGGLQSVGLTGSLTGNPADGLVIDDPFSSKEQADSLAYRNKVWSVWQAVVNTRLAPGAPIIIIMTRWHEDDLAGRLLSAEDAHRWRVINIPAQADYNPESQTDPLVGSPASTWCQREAAPTVTGTRRRSLSVRACGRPCTRAARHPIAATC